MSYFDPSTWRVFTREEFKSYLDRRSESAKSMGKGEVQPSTEDGGVKARQLNKMMVFQELLAPLDVYCYLKGRFGEPNGLQTFLKKDDSDNMFHWDYNLMAGDKELYFAGATQEIHVWMDDDFSDAEWIEFAKSLKSDFKNFGKQKSAVLHRLEKWSILPNHFVATANECSEYYEDIKRSLKAMEKIAAPQGAREYDGDYKKILEKQGKHVNSVRSACVKLNILMPVMFESFLGLLIAILIKPAVRKNRRMYEAFIRSPLDVKIFDLATRCRGFAKAIEPGNAAMARYWQIVNRRNDVIHGNLDVERDALDTVYFDKKTPLFRSGGDRIQAHLEGVIRTHDPEQVLSDYEATHDFILEIVGHLQPPIQEQARILISETEPGWDAKRGIFGKLFPSHVMSFTMDGLRYDSELSLANIVAAKSLIRN